MREEQIFQLKVTALQLALTPGAVSDGSPTHLTLAKSFYDWIIEETQSKVGASAV